MAVFYPRQNFATYLGNDKACLDYLALIKSLEQRISVLEGDAGNFFEIPSGDPFQLPGGDRLALPG